MQTQFMKQQMEMEKYFKLTPLTAVSDFKVQQIKEKTSFQMPTKIVAEELDWHRTQKFKCCGNTEHTSWVGKCQGIFKDRPARRFSSVFKISI